MSRSIGKLLLIAAAFIFSAAAAHGQQIQGQVRYADSGQPAFGVLVHSSGNGGSFEQMTDRNGKFFFRVSPGSYTITVRVPGYRQEDRSVSLTDRTSNEYVDIRLRDDGSGRAKAAAPGAGASESNVPAKAKEEFDKGAAAVALGKKENLEEAVLHLEKAVAAYPQYSQAYLMLGTTYLDLQQFDKAEVALKKTVEIDPKAANALFALGETYLKQKKNEDAEKVLAQGLQIEDRSYMGHLALARAYVAMAAKIKDETANRPLRVKAYDQVNQALKYNPDLALAHWLKGNLLVSVGRDADAKTEFEQYLRIDGKGPFASQAKTLIEKINKELEAQKKP